jgi:hypothetical protein
LLLWSLVFCAQNLYATSEVPLSGSLLGQVEGKGSCPTRISFLLTGNILHVRKMQTAKCMIDPNNSDRAYKVRIVPTTALTSFVGSVDGSDVELVISRVFKKVFFTEKTGNAVVTAEGLISEVIDQ